MTVVSGVEPSVMFERTTAVLGTLAPEKARSRFNELGFAGIVSSSVSVEGTDMGTLWALRRGRGGFTNIPLIDAFARHVALVLRKSEGAASMPLDERIAALESLDQLVLDVGNFEELVSALADRVAGWLGATMIGVMIWDEQRQVLQMTPGSFGADGEMAASYQISTFDSHSNAARVFTTRSSYLSNDAAGDPGILQDYVSIFGIRRILSVPLEMGGRPIGVLHLANKAAAFTMADLRRAETLAPRVATVVELARLLFRLTRRQRLEGILTGVAVAIASGESMQDFLVPALDDLCAVTEAGFIALVATDGEPAAASTGPHGHPELERILLREARDGPGVRAYVIVPQRAGDPGWAAFHVPVLLGSQRVGTVSALRIGGEPLAQEERHALSRLANLAALAYATERYQRQQAELARLRERQRIGDDLHDDVAQLLYAAQLNLDTALEAADLPPGVSDTVTRARGLLVRGDAAIRSVIHELSDPAPKALGDRLTAVAADVEEEFSMPVHVDVAPEMAAISVDAVRAVINDVLVRVTREALVNAAKHAGPCQAVLSLSITRRNRLLLTITDDGIGIRAGAHAGHGLEALRRLVRGHGGVLRLHVRRAGGTKLTVSVPL